MTNKIKANAHQDAGTQPRAPIAVPEAGRPAASQKKADEDAGIPPISEVSGEKAEGSEAGTEAEKVQEDFDYDSNGESLRRRSNKVGVNEGDRPL